MHGNRLDVYDGCSAYPALSTGRISVWRIDTARPIAPDAMAMLAVDERRRAATLSNTNVRRQYLHTRMALRGILGHYMGQPPDQVELRYGAHQKPEVIAPRGVTPLRFSLTHTRDMALIALTDGGEVGIDIEYARRRLNDLDALMDRTLAPEEAHAVRASPASDQAALFLRYWTAKEACLKAAGTGLLHGATAAVITMHADNQADGTTMSGPAGPRAAWRILFFQPAPGDPNYIGALAVSPPIQSALKSNLLIEPLSRAWHSQH